VFRVRRNDRHAGHETNLVIHELILNKHLELVWNIDFLTLESSIEGGSVVATLELEFRRDINSQCFPNSCYEADETVYTT
jgi:hypothetical protein